MAERERPSAKFVRKIREDLVESWARGLSEDGRATLSSHDLSALADNIAWRVPELMGLYNEIGKKNPSEPS